MDGGLAFKAAFGTFERGNAPFGGSLSEGVKGWLVELDDVRASRFQFQGFAPDLPCIVNRSPASVNSKVASTPVQLGLRLAIRWQITVVPAISYGPAAVLSVL